MDISDNKFTQVPKKMFRFLKKLECLNMSGNPIIQILDLQFIELHNSLVTLDLSGLRHLSSFSKYGFGGLIQLKVSSNTILLEGQKHFEFYLIDRYID